MLFKDWFKDMFKEIGYDNYFWATIIYRQRGIPNRSLGIPIPFLGNPILFKAFLGILSFLRPFWVGECKHKKACEGISSGLPLKAVLGIFVRS